MFGNRRILKRSGELLASEVWEESGERFGDVHPTLEDSGLESDRSVKLEILHTVTSAILVVVRESEEFMGFAPSVSSTTADAGGTTVN